MADWFNFNGLRSTDFGVYVMEFPPLSLPEERVDFKQVLGRSGSLTITEGEGVYNDILLSITCFMSDLSHIDQISAWLRGDGILVLGNMPNRYYKARPINQTDVRKIIRDADYRAFSMVFRCRPYRYINPAVDPITLTNGGSITNIGNTFCEPKYDIVATGDVEITFSNADDETIEDKTITLISLPAKTHITIDMELKVAYKTGSSNPLIPMTALVRKETWPFLIYPGRNDIAFGGTGSIASAKIDPRWRDV